MNSRHYIHKKIFIFITSLFALFILINMTIIKEARAATRCFFTKDGMINIQISSKTATSDIRYRTLGFTVTTTKQENKVASTDKDGNIIWGPDAPTGKTKVLNLKDGIKDTKVNHNTGETIVTYTYDTDKVKDLMRDIVDLDNLSKQTPIYFNAIFETYMVVDGKEVKLNQEVNTWKEIVSDQSWARPSDFENYFNIPIAFEPGLQPNSLYHDIDGAIEFQGDLVSAEIGDTVGWSNAVKEIITNNNNQYALVGYYAKMKADDKETDRRMVGDGITASHIKNGSTTVYYGGMNVYMIYRPMTANIILNAIDIDTGETIDENLYSGTVSAGQSFSEAVDLVIMKDNVTYSKLGPFYYVYVSLTGTKKVNDSGSPDGPVAFQIPADLKTPSTIKVRVYYKRIASGTIPVTVEAINADTGKSLQTLTTGTVNAGAKFDYTVGDTLTKDGKTYAFTGSWKWQYKKNTSSSPTVSGSGSGSNVSFTAPSADEIKGGITVYVYYKLSDIAEGDISLRVIMVSRNGSLISEISQETVTRGQSISISIPGSISSGSVVYKYIDIWDYSYYTSSGSKSASGSGGTVSFTVDSNTRLGTQITVRIYYDVTQEVVVPEPEPPITMALDSPSPYGVINGDKYGAPYFMSRDGISTTESQYVYVKTKDYLLGYKLVNRTGKVAFKVPVSMTYTLEFYTATPEEYGGPKMVTENYTDTQYITVERAYSYWAIASLEYYIPSSANVNNYSLPNGKVVLRTNSKYLNVPSLSTGSGSNIILPAEATEGIHLIKDEPIRSDNSDRPEIEIEDLAVYAFEMTGMLSVRNDYLSFNGSVVMSDSISNTVTGKPNVSPLVHSSNITHDKVLYTEDQIVDALKTNGIYKSTGSVIYSRHSSSVNASTSKSYNIAINDVIIHTPVICEPIIYSDNDDWVQLINPTENAYHLVLDTDTTLNDFTVRISNKLPHSDRLGYYERDFSRSFIDPENISYIAKKEEIVRNEMKLPFDVYIDTLNDMDPTNDVFIKAGTWIILGRNTYRFYVPMWVQEGTYTAQFRSIAVNGEDKLNKTETTRNTNRNNYVATATRIFQISGRMYGFTIYDISDEGRWRNVFRLKDTMLIKYYEGAEDGTKRTNYHDDYAYYYKVGLNDQYGYQSGRYNRFTLPILNGSHPKYKNVGAIKSGYALRFMLDTIGDMYSNGNRIRIIPTFYHVGKDGKNRQPVDIYYDEEFDGKHQRLVKIGQGIDLANLQQGLVGNIYSRIPEKELRHTAKVLGITYSKISNQFGPMYSYGDIRISSQFRTFIGLEYAEHITSLPSFGEVSEQINQTELSLSKYMQRWYGTYKLPTNIHVAPLGYDVNGYLKKYGIDYQENFWLKDGFIIINFNIESYDKNGNRNLSYINGPNYLNNGHCSMWITEGGVAEKSDNTDSTFSIRAGDVVFYHTGKKHSDDYIGRVY